MFVEGLCSSHIRSTTSMMSQDHPQPYQSFRSFPHRPNMTGSRALSVRPPMSSSEMPPSPQIATFDASAAASPRREQFPLIPQSPISPRSPHSPRSPVSPYVPRAIPPAHSHASPPLHRVEKSQGPPHPVSNHYHPPSRPPSANQHAENFSRPRKPSLRKPPEFPPTWPVLRNRSVSSGTSATFASFPLRPVDLDRRTRDRDLSVNKLPHAATWGTESEASRSSYKSMSTATNTVDTERSSVLTKDSPTASAIEESMCELSVEDVMGMYGNGNDEDSDGDDREDRVEAQANDEEGGLHRPATAVSHTGTGEITRRLTLTMEMFDKIQIPKTPAESVKEVELNDESATCQTAEGFTDTHLQSGAENSDALRTSSVRKARRPLLRSHQSQPLPHCSVELSAAEKAPPVPPLHTSSEATPATAGVAAVGVPSIDEIQLEEDPGLRDRYGFLKQTHYYTREQYDQWNSEYEKYLERRQKKWQQYLRDHGLVTQDPNRFPPPNAKTKRFVRKGIPPEYRGAAWFYYAGGPAILAKHAGVYKQLTQRKAKDLDIEMIEKDLGRTFPDNKYFKSPCSNEEPAKIAELRRVLQAFSIFNPQIGYCQSLNFIAGMLLLFVETEEQCFWLLNIVTRIYLPGTHEMSLEGSKVDLSVLLQSLKEHMPLVWAKVGSDLENEPRKVQATTNRLRRTTRGRVADPDVNSLPPITLSMTAWFMSCFIGSLPVEPTLRVWDVFFYEGSKTLFRIALTIFKIGEADIRALKDPMEMFELMQSLPRRMIDANSLIETCFKRRHGFGHISQDTIDQRRKDGREAMRLNREKLEKAEAAAVASSVSSLAAASGSTTAVSSPTGDSDGEANTKRGMFGRRSRKPTLIPSTLRDQSVPSKLMAA